MKYLCLDYGEKRTGVAVCDEGETMAFPRAAIIKKSREGYLAELVGLARAEGAAALVLGLPVSQGGGQRGESGEGGEALVARQIRNLAATLKKRLDLPVFLMDESFSSAEAESMLRESGQKPGKRDGRVDSLAAARILESFLHLSAEEKRLAQI